MTRRISFFGIINFIISFSLYSQQSSPAPTNFKVLPILSNTAILTWTPVVGATQYEIVDCSNSQIVATVQESNYKITGLVTGEVKQYKVKAILGTFYSEYTSCIDVKAANNPFNIFK